MESQPKAASDPFIESDEFPLKDYARERLAKTIADAEKKLLESDPSRYGLLEYYAREALAPGSWRNASNNRHWNARRMSFSTSASYLPRI
jgi:hypothetical protein